MAAPVPPTTEHKSNLRTLIWDRLRPFAFPDSRFSWDFSSFIPDFVGSSEAATQLTSLPIFTGAALVFCAPDNSLEAFRAAALRAGKPLLVTTYGLRRGFVLLDPALIPAEKIIYAATLDGMERCGRIVSLAELRRWGAEEGKMVDLLVTGTGAVNTHGLRFGKGHGYFDVEWALLFTLGLVRQETPTVAVVHDLQIVDARETEMVVEDFDVPCDVVVTGTRVLDVKGQGIVVKKPECGILWDRLAEGMMEDIQPLKELKDMAIKLPHQG